MARKFFASSFGGIRLWLSSISTTSGRDLVITPYTRGNVPFVDDRGDSTKEARCAFLLDDFPGETRAPEDRMRDLLDLKSLGARSVFTHPLEGSYFAFIHELNYEIDENGNFVNCSITFVATEESNPRFDPIGVSIDTTIDAIETRRLELLSELESVDVMSEIPDLAVATQATFAKADIDPRSVLVSLSQVSDRMWGEIDSLSLEADVELWPLMKSYIMLGDALRTGADSTLGDLGNFMMVRIDQSTCLRRLMADIYGASEAEQRTQEASETNDIRTPARIEGVTQLRLRQPSRARESMR